jgi:hypothetical protein
MPRDDFKQTTKTALAKRVGYCCSLCSASTLGPDATPDGSVNIGVAAHMSAAAEGGPRYDADMSPEDRAHISNGIWLCQNCAKQIDDDVARFDVEALKEAKVKAEELARRQLPAILSEIEPLDIDDPLVVVYRLLENSQDWRCPNQEEKLFYCFVNPTYSVRVGETIRQRFYEKWMATFPDGNGSSERVQLYWNETPIYEMSFVSCDGGRFFIPMPQYKDDGSLYIRKDSMEHRVARLFRQYMPLDSTIQRCGVELF